MQLNAHRRKMNEAVLRNGGTVMQYVGDAVMAVFGPPELMTRHQVQAVEAAVAMHRGQHRLNQEWAEQGLPPFGLGIGLSTGLVAAAFLGSQERMEYTVVGDTVNLAARLCDLARPAGTTVASAATLVDRPTTAWQRLAAVQVKGRTASVSAYRLETEQEPPSDHGDPQPDPGGSVSESPSDSTGRGAGASAPRLAPSAGP
jgi:class 3 adenylate cyclase